MEKGGGRMTAVSAMPTTSLRDAAPARARKVLHFIPTVAGGGAENFLLNLMTQVRGSRWQHVVLAACVHPHEARAEQLRSLGCRVVDLNEPALMKASLWKAVRRTIAQEAPDVLQTWMHHADLIGATAAWFAGVHSIVWGVRATEVHRNPGDSDLKTTLFHQALRWGSKVLPSRIIANSTAAIDVHCGMGFPRSKMVWIPNGVNATRFAPDPVAREQTRASLSLDPQTPAVGFVGRFHPVKDIACFFRAAAHLQAIKPDVHFVLVGGTQAELYPEAREAFERLRDTSVVHFVPFGSATEKFYPAFDVFTLCSKSEAFPNVVLEAMACGLPSVTTDAGDCTTMLRDLGKVVPVGAAEALAQGWLEMLSLTADQRTAIAEQCRTRAVNTYSMERAAHHFEEVYDSLMR